MTEALAEQDQFVVMAGRVARLGGWIVDLRTGLVELSDVACAIHEVPSGTSFAVQRGIDYYAPEFRPAVAAAFAACAKDGVPFDMELVIVSATGRRMPVRAIAEAVRGPDGSIERVQGSFQDVTAIHESNADSDGRYRGLLEAAPDAMVVVNQAGEIVLLNLQAEKQFGYRRDELVGQQVTNIIPEGFA
ncbi:MAG: PAS domain-containing protein, partial [Candidatus Limnocylindrales bacterium]